MMALSALSLARQDGGQNVLALQHYQLAFPSLQTSLRHNQDLCSDGLFLTHFLLLVYEVSVDRFRYFDSFSPLLARSSIRRRVAHFNPRLRRQNREVQICGPTTSHSSSG